ncbi:hypothetical protein CsSME_00016568 [Camellia sinensis var. sinensis]
MELGEDQPSELYPLGVSSGVVEIGLRDSPFSPFPLPTPPPPMEATDLMNLPSILSLICPLLGGRGKVITTEFSVELHHGGYFTKPPNRVYKGGKVNYFQYFDPTRVRFFDFQKLYLSLGHEALQVLGPNGEIIKGPQIPQIEAQIELDEEGINGPEMEEDEWGNETENEEKNGGDKEMNDSDDGDSTDLDWMNDGLEGSEDEDIFGYVDKDVGVESNVGVDTNVGIEPYASGSNEWFSDRDFEMHTLYGSSDEEKMDDRLQNLKRVWIW